jgi:hypothetical protein
MTALSRFWVVIDEAVVRRIVASATVMRDHIEVLIGRGSLPNVTLQVNPFGAGAHPGLDSTFTLLHFEEAALTSYMWRALIGNIYLERAKDLEGYARTLDWLRAVALGPRDSATYPTKIADELPL